jgi:hypothetical protein
LGEYRRKQGEGEQTTEHSVPGIRRKSDSFDIKPNKAESKPHISEELPIHRVDKGQENAESQRAEIESLKKQLDAEKKRAAFMEKEIEVENSPLGFEFSNE